MNPTPCPDCTDNDTPMPVADEAPTYALFRKLNDATGELRRHVMAEKKQHADTEQGLAACQQRAQVAEHRLQVYKTDHAQLEACVRLLKGDNARLAARVADDQRRIDMKDEEISTLKNKMAIDKQWPASAVTDTNLHDALNCMHTRDLIAEKQAEMRLMDCKGAEAELAASKQRVRELEAKLNNVRDMLVQGGTP